MGCDYYADDEGRFELEIRDARGRVIGSIEVEGLEPGAKIYRDLLAGRSR